MAQKKLSEGRRQAVRETLDESVTILSETGETVRELEELVMRIGAALNGCISTRDMLEGMYTDRADEFSPGGRESLKNIDASIIHTDHKVELARRRFRDAVTDLDRVSREASDTVLDIQHQIEQIKRAVGQD